MSYQSTMLVQCENLQEKLETAWMSNQVADSSPFLEYLNSPENTAGINQVINPGQGKSRTLNLTYFPRLSETENTEATGRPCSAQDKIGNNVAQYEIDTEATTPSGERIAIEDLTRFCDDNDSYIAQVLARHLDVMDRKIAVKTATEATALVGQYSADTIAAYSLADPSILTVTTKTSGLNVFGAYEKIQAATIMSGFGGYVHFGGQLMFEHMRLSLAGCCTNDGLSVPELYNLYGSAFAYDRRLATALGSVTTESLVFRPQALQLLTYVQSPAYTPNMNWMSNYSKFVLFTPAGVPVDVLIKDDCGVIDINMYAATKLVALPSEMFLTGDNFAGVNFVGQVSVVNT